MKLDEKRKVIEVLLCAGQWPDQHGKFMTTFDAARRIGIPGRRHGTEWASTRNSYPVTAFPFRAPSHGNVCIEAAYRLIESSPTLIREWFARRGAL